MRCVDAQAYGEAIEGSATTPSAALSRLCPSPTHPPTHPTTPLDQFRTVALPLSPKEKRSASERRRNGGERGGRETEGKRGVALHGWHLPFSKERCFSEWVGRRARSFSTTRYIAGARTTRPGFDVVTTQLRMSNTPPLQSKTALCRRSSELAKNNPTPRDTLRQSEI